MFAFFFTVKCVLGVGTVDNLFLFALVSTFFFTIIIKCFCNKGKKKKFSSVLKFEYQPPFFLSP